MNRSINRVYLSASLFPAVLVLVLVAVVVVAISCQCQGRLKVNVYTANVFFYWTSPAIVIKLKFTISVIVECNEKRSHFGHFRQLLSRFQWVLVLLQQCITNFDRFWAMYRSYYPILRNNSSIKMSLGWNSG